MTKSVKEIIIEYLKAVGYNGLCTDDCGCGIDDIVPCGNNFENCVVAEYTECKDCPDKRDCSYRDVYSATNCYRPIEFTRNNTVQIDNNETN